MLSSQPIPLCCNNRDTTLDIAKGLLIILVVLGHAIQYSFGTEYTQSREFFSNIVFKTIYSFHMPLFMLISGYLFHNSNKKDFKTLMVSKLIAIGIPMISTPLLLFASLSFARSGISRIQGPQNVPHTFIIVILLFE